MPRPLRVCLVSAAYRPYPSGLSEHVRNLALGLRRLGLDVAVLTTRFAGADDNAEPFAVKRCGRALLVPMNGSYATLPIGLRLGVEVRDYLAAQEFDIVHCHGLHWPEISYWAIRHSRSVNLVTCVSAGFRIHTTGSGLYRFLFRRHLSRIRARIAVSRRARDAAEPYVPGDWRIIPCGVDLERFRPGLPAPEALGRGTGGRKSDAPLILFLGRLDRRKGLAVLLRALPLIRTRLPDVRLVVVGSGPLEADSRRLARRLGIAGCVDFVGRPGDDDVPAWFASADLYCSPALGGETLGIVLLEALACGTPTIASRIPGYDETIRDGTDGVLFTAGNAAALADAAVRVLSDPDLAARLRAAGPVRAEAYAWPRVCAQTLELYQELLSGPPASSSASALNWTGARVSARAAGSIPARLSAATALSRLRPARVARLLAIILRRWAKLAFTTRRNSASSVRSNSGRASRVKRNTVETTSGLGLNAPGSMLNSLSRAMTRAKNTETAP